MSHDPHDEDAVWTFGLFFSAIMWITYVLLDLNYEIELTSYLTTNIPDSGVAFYSSCCFSLLVWVVPGQILARVLFSYPLTTLFIIPIVIYLFAGTYGCFTVLFAIGLILLFGAALVRNDDKKSGDAALLMVLASENGGESLTNNIPRCSICRIRPVQRRISGVRYRHGDVCMSCDDDEC